MTILLRYWPAIAGIVLVALILLLVRCSDRTQDHAVAQAQQAGASQQRADDLQTTLERTEQAHEAARQIERDPDARHASCLRYSRTPENCH